MIQVGLPSRGKTLCGIIVALFLLSGGRAAAQNGTDGSARSVD